MILTIFLLHFLAILWSRNHWVMLLSNSKDSTDLQENQKLQNLSYGLEQQLFYHAFIWFNTLDLLKNIAKETWTSVSLTSEVFL